MAVRYSGLRESRQNRYNDLGGSSVDIADRFEKKCIKKAERSFEQGLQCQEINSLQALVSIEDSLLIVHSPQGCLGCVSAMQDLFRVGQIHRGVKHVRNARLLCTNLDKKSVIFGGEKKLRHLVHADHHLRDILPDQRNGIVHD